MNSQNSARNIYWLGMPVVLLCVVFLNGCVRVAGTAGYWNTGPDGQMESKQAGFDTQKLVSKGKTPRSVTI